MKKKLLITGGSGFVGQNIIRLAMELKLPIEIFNLSRTALEINGVHHIQCADAADFDFGLIHEQFDYIIHTLALSNEKYCENFEYAQKVNIQFTKRLLEFCREQEHLKKLVHTSSIIVYDNTNPPPVREGAKLYLHYSNYGFTKGISEYYVEHYREKYGVPAITFRLSNIYGPYQNIINSPFLIPSKIIQALDEGRIEVFNLSPRRDWIYSLDAAHAFIKALDVPVTGIFNLGSGQGTSVEELVTEISNELRVPFTSLNKPTSGPIDFYCDISRTKEILSWGPTTSLHDGMKHTIDHIRSEFTKS